MDSQHLPGGFFSFLSPKSILSGRKVTSGGPRMGVTVAQTARYLMPPVSRGGFRPLCGHFWQVGLTWDSLGRLSTLGRGGKASATEALVPSRCHSQVCHPASGPDTELPSAQAEAQGLEREVAGSSPRTPARRGRALAHPEARRPGTQAQVGRACAPGHGGEGAVPLHHQGAQRRQWKRQGPGEVGTGGRAVGGCPVEEVSRDEVPLAVCSCV